MLTFIKKNIFPTILLVIFGFIFFFRLDYNTLASWDEAWYASISREIVRTGDFFNLVWNGHPYFDHPPLGFWVMAASYKIFGISEFSTRLPSAIFGILSILFLYKFASLIFKNKHIGFASSLILGTCVWYVIRVRSGNLDSLLVFLYITTVYFAARASINMRWLPFTAFSLACLMLSKTLVGLPALLLIIILISNQLHYKLILKNSKYILVSMIVFFAVVFPWYFFSIITHAEFFERHFIQIGLRNKTAATSFLNINTEQPLFFLHMGIRKWYYIWVAASTILLSVSAFLRKGHFLILIWNVAILFPFLTSKETELWHLIPVYVPVSLIISSGLYLLLDPIALVARTYLNKKIDYKKIFTYGYLGLIIAVSLLQVKTFYSEVYPIEKYIGDDIAVARQAGKYNKPIYLDDDFTPIANYYSGHNTISIAYLPDNKKTLATFFKSYEKNYVVITRNWAVDNLVKEKIPYTLLYKNNSFSIVAKP